MRLYRHIFTSPSFSFKSSLNRSLFPTLLFPLLPFFSLALVFSSLSSVHPSVHTFIHYICRERGRSNGFALKTGVSDCPCRSLMDHPNAGNLKPCSGDGLHYGLRIIWNHSPSFCWYLPFSIHLTVEIRIITGKWTSQFNSAQKVFNAQHELHGTRTMTTRVPLPAACSWV